jgi:hypothetical protein
MNTDDLNHTPSLPPERPEDEENHLAPVETEVEAGVETEAETLVDEDTARLPHDEEAAPEEEERADSIQPVIPPDEPAPNSAAPPRIVSETPLGGAPRPHPVVHTGPSPAPPARAQSAPENVDEVGADLSASAAESAAVIAPRAETPPGEDAPVEPGAPAVVPAPPPSRVTVTQEEPAIKRAEDWDDQDISPELASVLFGGRKSKPDAAPTESTEIQAPAVPAPAPIEAEPPAAPISLTNVAAARHMRITAEAHSAAAPEATLLGKKRYMRIEEPLSGDKGQRTTETWTYFKPDYPSLDGRLVKLVKSEEIVYADGSWWWRYERRYSDRGRDRREVRTNTDQTYVERKDEVSKLAPQAGKRLQYKEEAAMILSAPEREEKRGFLSGLLGRDADDDQTDSARTWREATSSESRQARKHGGAALKRRFLGIF